MAVAHGKAYWAQVLGNAVQGEYDNEPLWKIELHVTDEERERLEGLGIKGKQKDPNVFVFKRALKNKKTGKDNVPPSVVDSSKNTWDEAKLIGNESEVNVAFSTYPHPMDKQHGLGKGLQAVQVLNHVAYGGGAGVDEFADETVHGDATDEF